MLPPESSNTTPTTSSHPTNAEPVSSTNASPDTSGQSDRSTPTDIAGDDSLAVSAKHRKPSAERRWPARAALVMSWILPATTARRTAHVSLAQAWGVHVVGLVFGGFALALLEKFARLPGSSSKSIDAVLFETWQPYSERLHERTVATIAMTGGVFLLIEAAFLGVAILSMPWGAMDERIRDNLSHSLRQVWLRTVHVGMAIVIGALLAGQLHAASLAWTVQIEKLRTWQEPSPPPPVTLGPDEPGYAEAKNQFDRAMAEHQQAAREWREAWLAFQQRSLYGGRPWYVRHDDGIVVVASFGLALWFVWATLRAIGARRDVPPVARPPTCELCGYNLTTLSMDARCPECGEPVANSLGPGNRPGTTWETHQVMEAAPSDPGESVGVKNTGAAPRPVGLPSALLRTAFRAFRDPDRLGRMIAITTWSTAHRWFLAMHLVVIFLIGLGTSVCLWWTTTGHQSKHVDCAEIGLFGTLAGIICVIGAIGWCVGSATVIGLVQSWRCRRNLLPASMRVSAYLAGYLVLWAALGGAMIDLWIIMDRSNFFRQIGRPVGINGDFLGAITWLIPQIVCAVGHWSLLFRGTSAARYANR